MQSFNPTQTEPPAEFETEYCNAFQLLSAQLSLDKPRLFVPFQVNLNFKVRELIAVILI